MRDVHMLALSIRQPYAEQILRGVKRVEYRNRRTHVIGERFYIYACLRRETKRRGDAETKWGDLPTGVIVGTAIITRVTGSGEKLRWHLAEVKRLARPIKPQRHPQPSWFNPF